MSIRDIIADDMAATCFDVSVDETPAETSAYTTAAGEESSVTAVWSSSDASRTEPIETGRARTRLQRVAVAASEVAAPSAGDLIARSDPAETWTIIAVDPIGAGAANLLTVKRSEGGESSRGGYRIER